MDILSGTFEIKGPEFFALVELMGHGRVVGRVTQPALGDGKLIQVDLLEWRGPI